MEEAQVVVEMELVEMELVEVEVELVLVEVQLHLQVEEDPVQMPQPLNVQI